MRKKLAEISSYESVLCLFVVMIHIMSDSINGYADGSFLQCLSVVFTKSITFVVPAFVMTSAIKFSHGYSEGDFNYLTFLKRRILKIYIPYLIVATIYYLYFVYVRGYFPFNWGALFKHLSLGTIAAPFYFIVIIMQLYLIAPITLMLCKALRPVFGLLVAFLISVLSRYFMLDFQYFDKIFLGYFIYWILGCYLGINFDMNLMQLKNSKKAISILAISFTAIYCAVSLIEFLGIWSGFSIEILKVFFACFSAIMWLIIMPEYSHEAADIISPTTYYIYLIHCLIIFETERLMLNWQIVSIPLRFVILVFFTYTASILLSFIYTRLKWRLGFQENEI